MPQVRPHVAQLVEFHTRSTGAVPHTALPAGQAQAPARQLVPALVMPQASQWPWSVRKSTPWPWQEVRPLGRWHAPPPHAWLGSRAWPREPVARAAQLLPRGVGAPVQVTTVGRVPAHDAETSASRATASARIR